MTENQDTVPRRDRDTKAVEGEGYGEGISLSSRLGSLGECCKLPQQGPGQSPSRKWIWYILSLKKTSDDKFGIGIRQTTSG